jgi:hypothetical protein
VYLGVYEFSTAACSDPNSVYRFGSLEGGRDRSGSGGEVRDFQ